MRHLLVRATVLVALILGVSRVFAYPFGAVPTRTGARAFPGKPAEPTCTVCHTPFNGVPSGINDPSGSVHILDVPAHYAPSTIYTLRVVLQHDWAPVPPDPLRWGFQIEAIQGTSGDASGDWILPPNAAPDSFKIVKGISTSVYKNRRYVDQAGYLAVTDEHPGSPTHYGEVGPVEWHVKWQSPAGDSGKVYFFAAGNSTNGDDACGSSGDFVFTTSESTIAQGNTGVLDEELRLGTRLDTPTPNPMRGWTDLSFAIAKGGVVDLSVFDLSGRRVRTLLHEFREAGTHLSGWSGKNDRGELCRNGVYFVRLTSPDQRQVTRKVTLDR